jgi:threonine dehydratase
MPHDAPAVKVAATHGYGAEVIFYNRLTDDREAFTNAIAKQRGLTLVPPYDHPHIMAGAGTAALEFLEDYPQISAILAPIGGGGLISGTAIAAHGVNPQLHVIGVEPADADDTARSLAAGERVRIAPPQTIADGLRITMPGALTFPIVQRHLSDVLIVSDDQIREAIRFAFLRLKLVIEPSGAAVLAAVLAGYLPPSIGPIGLIISGGNIDPELLAGLWGA